MRRFFLALALVAAAASPALAAGPARINVTWYGEVVSLSDGDTLTVRNGGRDIRVRLYGVDAPEKRQAYGRRAADLAKQLADGVRVSVRQLDRDRYGRIVAIVGLPGGKILQEEMLRSGLTWVYWDYIDASLKPVWADMMFMAKRGRKGLWQDSRPTPPWVWRRTH